MSVKAFERNQLRQLRIRNSVKTIGYNAFANNPLTNVTMPKIFNNIFGKEQI
jgi:hypothetical protein